MKIRPVGAELFHGGRTDEHADMTKLIVAFRNFANALKTPKPVCYSPGDVAIADT
jgi:hypothetical protein